MTSIVVAGLEKCRNVIDVFTSSAQKICVRCRNFDEITRSSIMDILPNLLHLEENCFMFIGQISDDKGKGHTDIMVDIFEH